MSLKGIETLADCQKLFWLALTDADNNLLSHINDSDVGASDRLEIYRTTARSVHISVLSSIYPVCNKILGDDYFKLIAKKYFKTTPSISADLNEYGEYFSSYLKQMIYQRAELNEYLYLPDLASLEWTMHVLYYCADAKLLDIEKLQQMYKDHGGDIKLSLASNVVLHRSKYPVTRIWQAHQGSNHIDIFEMSDSDELVCVYRRKFEVVYELIDKHTYKLLSAINSEATLNEIVGYFDDSRDLNSALKLCIAKQWLRI